jgi:hypothetical protein
MENIDVIKTFLRCFENDKPKKMQAQKHKEAYDHYKMYYIYDLKISITN